MAVLRAAHAPDPGLWARLSAPALSQATHLSSPATQTFSTWPLSPHLLQAKDKSGPLQSDDRWPKPWHRKQRVGACFRALTGQIDHPTFTFVRAAATDLLTLSVATCWPDLTPQRPVTDTASLSLTAIGSSWSPGMAAVLRLGLQPCPQPRRYRPPQCQRCRPAETRSRPSHRAWWIWPFPASPPQLRRPYFWGALLTGGHRGSA